MTTARKTQAAALALVGSFAAFAAPAYAHSAAEYFRAHAATNTVPNLLSRDERQFYVDLFDAIDRSQWSKVQSMLAQKPEGPLHEVALARYYLAPNSPKVELPAIQAWLEKGRDLPQAEQIARLGLRRGAETMPALPMANSLVSQPYAPKRTRPSPVNDGTMPQSIADAMYAKIKNDDPDGARQLLDGIDGVLSPATRAEWRQRVAWSYYIENQDAQALAIAQTVPEGLGAWSAEGNWTAGLAAWRLGDCDSAAASFEKTAQRASNLELQSAAYYWASRSYIRCRKPERSQEMLRGAASRDETLYGMLAAEQLGINLPKSYAAADFSRDDWTALSNSSNVRAAVALMEIGRDDMAGEMLRYQAKIGAPTQYGALSRLARDLGLPGTQLWMSYNAPYGAKAEPASRYPTPKWQPVTGWKVDPALVYAHSLQESNFQPKVVSPAGARGLMQIMPGTAQTYASSINMSASYAELSQPEVNMAYGQRTLEALRDSPGTEGKLPKIMAAYNAGIAPVMRWNSEIRGGNDPLLWMESIPYWETRGYVAIVMRNYWMYERQANAASPSRQALAEVKWPTFPNISAGNLRLAANDGTNGGN